MNDYVGKPIDAEVLVATLLRHVSGIAAASTTASVAQAAPAPALIAIDGIDLARALQRLGNNLTLYRSVLGGFRAESAQLVPALQFDLTQQRWRDAANRLHGYKSSAGTVGANALQVQAATLEAALRGTDPAPEIDSELHQLDRLIKAALAALDTLERQWPAADDSAGAGEGSDDAERADLLPQLRMLDALLAESNMGAVDAFGHLRRQHREALTGNADALGASIANLDFQQALADSAQLRTRLIEAGYGAVQVTATADGPAIGTAERDRLPPELLALAARSELDLAGAVARFCDQLPLYSNALGGFARSIQDMSTQLPLLLNQQSSRSLEHMLHSLEGTAATVGADRLAQHAAQATMLLRDGDQQPALGISVHQLAAALADAGPDLAQIAVALEHLAQTGAADATDALDRADLQALAALLEASNMDAVEAFHRLQAALLRLAPATAAQLGRAIDDLDFAGALTLCQQLLALPAH
jgi:HPt (histidine-containing phosphotransfer) domain-containing protein